MDYKFKINEENHEIQAERPGEAGAINVVLDGQEKTVIAKAVSPGHIGVRIDDKTYNMFVAPEKDGTWVWIDGKARFAQDADKTQRRRSSSAGGGPTQVTPPTPATVTKVLVEVGQSVEKGRAAVVVTAMKMEITLAAPYSGTVTSINTEVGSQVKPGDILVDIEPTAEGEEAKDE